MTELQEEVKSKKAIKKIDIKAERCKSCGICIEFCPKQALSYQDQINQGGYNYTQVDDAACIGCGICYQVCPDGVFTILGR